MPYNRHTLAEALLNEMREAMSKPRYESKLADKEETFDSDLLFERIQDILRERDEEDAATSKDERIKSLEDELRELRNKVPSYKVDKDDTYADVKDDYDTMKDRHEREREIMIERHEREREHLKERHERELDMMKKQMKNIKFDKDKDGKGRGWGKPESSKHPGERGQGKDSGVRGRGNFGGFDNKERPSGGFGRDKGDD